MFVLRTLYFNDTLGGISIGKKIRLRPTKLKYFFPIKEHIDKKKQY
jgi:hypothetical protein